MLHPFRAALADPLLRLSFVCLTLTGVGWAMVVPYQSVIGIERLGMGDGAYAMMNTFGALFSMVAAVAVGILCDQTGRFRGILLASLGVGLVGAGIMVVAPSLWNFVLFHAVLGPVAGTAFTQYFALAMMASQQNPNVDKAAGLGLVRAGFAGAFAIVPPVWAIAVARGVDVLVVYALVFGIQLAVLAIVYWLWPSRTAATGSGLSFAASLREVSTRFIWVRLGLVSVATSSVMVYNIVLGLLILNTMGGSLGDVGLFAGLVAGVEIPVMLAAAALLKQVDRVTMIMVGVLIHALSFAVMGLVTDIRFAWPFIIPMGIGAGIVLSVPLGYVQDLVAHRAGAGSSLLSITQMGSAVFASGVFAVGTAIAGYQGAAVLGGAVALLAGMGLFWVERRGRAV